MAKTGEASGNLSRAEASLLISAFQNNTCPLCRAVMDSSVPPRNPVLDDPVIASSVASENYTNQMLSLFRAVFGRQEQHNDGQGENFRRQGREEFSGMYS